MCQSKIGRIRAKLYRLDLLDRLKKHSMNFLQNDDKIQEKKNKKKLSWLTKCEITHIIPSRKQTISHSIWDYLSRNDYIPKNMNQIDHDRFTIAVMNMVNLGYTYMYACEIATQLICYKNYKNYTKKKLGKGWKTLRFSSGVKVCVYGKKNKIGKK